MKQTFLLLCFLTLFACRKDSETTTENESNHIPKVFLIDDFEQTDEPVTASVFGKVLNQNGYPVANAQVTLGSETLLTNDQGVFLFRETTMNATGTFIQVEKKPFFFAGGTRFFPKEGSENYVTIRLLPKETGSSFRSDEDVISEFEENLTIVLQANSLLLPNGTTYEGSVTPYIHQLRTERENMIDFLPGNLQGIDRTSKEVALSTFGAVALDFYSENGERLSLDEEKKVELSFLVSENHLAIAPEKISTWFFNEGYGLWQEQGDFVLEEGKYTGVIKQLGFFQLAVPSPKVSLSGSLQNQNEQPFPNLQIKITDEESLISSFAYTDNEGFFNLPIPSDKSIKLNVLLSESDCQVFEQAEEIVSTDKNLGNIILSETNTLALTSVTGTLVDCVTENISDYFVEVITEPQDYCYYNLNGNQINLSVPICNGGDVLSVNIKDMNDIHESGILTADLGVDLDLGETLLCGDGEADYIAIKFPGNDALFFYDPTLVIDGINEMTRITGFEDTLEQIDISFDGLTIGTYMDTDVNFFKGAFPNSGDAISINCDTGCGFDQLIIEEYGAEPGQRIRGNFSGGSVFSLISGPGNADVQVPFEGEFSVTIRE